MFLVSTLYGRDEYCNKNNIKMTRLPYTMSCDEIKDAIKNIINP